MLIPGAAILVAASIAYAATEYKFESGECDNGNRWWSVSEFNGGELVGVSGIGCDGNRYVRHPLRERVASDPTAGTTPTFTGEGWYASIRYDDLHRAVWAGGKDVEGYFWVTTDITYEQSGVTGGGERIVAPEEEDIH